MVKLKSKIIKGKSDPKETPKLQALEELLKKEFSSPNKKNMETFENREDAEEYILYPFPSVEYSLVIHEED